MELTTSTKGSVLLAVGLCFAMGGCASAGRLAEIDAKYDAILVSDCRGDKVVCWHQEMNRQKEKEYANSPMQRLGNFLGLKGGGTNTNFVVIMN